MGVDIQGKLRLALGSMKDHASIGKAMMYHHQHDGFSSIEIAVLRATGHDNGTIDDKYMHEILFLVSHSQGSIPFLAERISRRLCKTKDHLVALKVLVLIHRLLRGGNRSFEQELCKAHVSGHLQISTTRCFTKNSDPSIGFLHKYASYLEERMSWLINQAGKLEPLMSKGLGFRSYDENSIDMVFRTLPKYQVLIDKVLEFSPHDVLLSDHSLAQVAMSNILRESFQVYMTFSEGIAALINMFFDLNSSAKGLACEILKKASLQSQKLHDLYESCKQVVENKNLEYPFVKIISMSHIVALDQFGCQQNQIASSHVALSSNFKRSTEIEFEVAAKESKKKEEKIDINLSPTPTLFSWTLETKISKVWVVFEDEVVPNESQVLPAPQKLGDVDVVSDIESEYGRPSVFLNPFSSSIDTTMSSKV
ncbi:putative clathrin assembly protein At1g33340 [Gastrolobium bilobum]|uniref:putative clathrin assembly protein At1g33340 n=1 Tax=Gastrolobium bilobum TaxID=150636 RepID=UPI002AAFA717|nr:putative clathrin assembly protein At1g33340 [Gastrolobium bilobum]